jgi:DNA-binding MarR family transcriptional regulator
VAAVQKPLGMTITHHSCLELLAQGPGPSNSWLARCAFGTRQSMNVFLPALEREGLVARPAQAPVGRGLPTELTARGRRHLKVAGTAVRRVEQDMSTTSMSANKTRCAVCSPRASPH